MVDKLMAELTYSEILRENSVLGKELEGRPGYSVAILSNIVVTPLNGILEHSLRRAEIPATASSGDYDNILQDTLRFQKSDLVIIFWEACNLRPSLQARADLLEEREVEELITAVKSEIDFALHHLRGTALVMVNYFSALAFNCHALARNNFDRICDALNVHLDELAKTFRNLFLIDVERVLATVSVAKSVDFRFFYSSRALYSVDFFKAYADHVLPIVKSTMGKAKKALIFDCDNTLWKGVLGEDGFDGIEMSKATKAGAIFEEIQQIALKMSRQGVLIGICSKNNPADIEEVFRRHPDAGLRDENIAIQKVNWTDKATNLAEIAATLNIGVDSLVFFDDSEFEIELLAGSFPELLTIKVPKNLYEYPDLLRRTSRLFFSATSSREDAERGKLYKRQAERVAAGAKFENIEEYLASLDLKIAVSTDDIGEAVRLAQLTQKTNQFNLTTKRYSETEVRHFIESPLYSVISFSVADKFGSCGVVGLAIVERNEATKEATIDTFLMSCRTIGRNVEFALADFLIAFLREKGMLGVAASYVASPKNAQVADFYRRLGFEEIGKIEREKTYRLTIESYHPRNLNYIRVEYGKQN